MTTHDDEQRAERATALDDLLSKLPAIREKYDARMSGSVGMSWDHDDIAAMLQAIDLLLAEKHAARDTTSVYTPPVGVCFTVYNTNSEDRPDNHVFEQHKANPNGTPQCGTRYPLQPYAPFIAADLCPRCYPAPAQPSAPAVAAISDEALMVLHDIAEGESTGDPEEYRTGDSMISQEMRVIDDELEPHYVEVVDDLDSDGEPIWFWIVTPAGLALLRNTPPSQPDDEAIRPGESVPEWRERLGLPPEVDLSKLDELPIFDPVAVQAQPDYRVARGALAGTADEPAEVSIRRQRDGAQPEAATGAKLTKAQYRELDDLHMLGELTYNRKILPATFKLMQKLHSQGLVELVGSTENTATYKITDAGRTAVAK